VSAPSPRATVATVRRLWDDEASWLPTLRGHTGRVNSAVFAPDGSSVHSPTQGGSGGTVRTAVFAPASHSSKVTPNRAMAVARSSRGGRCLHRLGRFFQPGNLVRLALVAPLRKTELTSLLWSDLSDDGVLTVQRHEPTSVVSGRDGWRSISSTPSAPIAPRQATTSSPYHNGDRPLTCVGLMHGCRRGRVVDTARSQPDEQEPDPAGGRHRGHERKGCWATRSQVG
jgi:hypothetical protein